MRNNVKKIYEQPQFAVIQLETADVIVCSPYEVKGKSDGAGQTAIDFFSLGAATSSWEPASTPAPASAPEPAPVPEPQSEPVEDSSEEVMSSN